MKYSLKLINSIKLYINLRDRDTEPLEKIALPDERKRILFKKIIKHKVITF